MPVETALNTVKPDWPFSVENELSSVTKRVAPVTSVNATIVYRPAPWRVRLKPGTVTDVPVARTSRTGDCAATVTHLDDIPHPSAVLPVEMMPPCTTSKAEVAVALTNRMRATLTVSPPPATDPATPSRNGPVAVSQEARTGIEASRAMARVCARMVLS